jgi:hypothetical protein
VIHPGYINITVGRGPGGMPTLRRSKPVRRVRQDPPPNAIQLAPPTDVRLSYRKGKDLAETARANTNYGNADKADESKPAHDKFLNCAPFEHASKMQSHAVLILSNCKLIDGTDTTTKSQRPVQAATCGEEIAKPAKTSRGQWST